MSLLDQLFSWRGRINRGDFWYATLLMVSVFIVLNVGLTAAFGTLPALITLVLHVVLYWSLFGMSVKRYHDLGRSGWWLLLLLIPLIGPAWVFCTLFFRKGNQAENRYGPVSLSEQLDYLSIDQQKNGANTSLIINDVTQLNPVQVLQVLRPESIDQLQKALAETTGPISIGGGRFSMGGQTASPDSLHLDIRALNKVLLFSPQERWVRVQTGIRWCDLQQFIDPHHLSIKIMQTYANFTVGGSLNVNSHGRYIGQGPLIRSVRAITVLLADGRLVHATPSENSELFFGAIGGYGGLGVIVEAELDLVPNCRVQRITRKLPLTDYLSFFRSTIRNDRQAIFHNGDIYPPRYSQVRSNTWVESDKPVTQTNRLFALNSSFLLERYVYWAITETPLGAWRREYLYDPLLLFRNKVHWRNYEAGYDVAELEPASRKRSTYVLQEYFAPVDRFNEFASKMGAILQQHGVKVVNISIRHALPDTGSLLAWAREEVFAFVLYYKQGVEEADRTKVSQWTRELVDAVLEVGGTYYLPYQPHPTREQFQKAYPRAQEWFALKRKLDPHFRFHNVLWDRYYAPTLEETT